MKEESAKKTWTAERIVRTLLGILSLAAVVAVAWWESQQRTSPGDLHPSHASVKELQGTAGCAACHGVKGEAMDTACLKCHEDIKAQIQQSAGIHGALAKVKSQQCKECHTDHTGIAIPLVSAKSFALANLTKTVPFDHAQVRPFTLSGTHEKLDCVRCHTSAESTSIKPGEFRFLGLSQDCKSCHDDPHKGSFGASCASCHGQDKPFKEVAAFNHTDAFPLTGGHAGKSCADCHAKEGATSIDAAMASKGAPPRDCSACHQDPHSDTFVGGIASASGKAPGQTCVLCHDANAGTFLAPKATLAKEQHAATGFALTPPHDTVACEKCHAAMGTREKLAKGDDLKARYATFFPGRAQNDCKACHKDPHNGAFDAGFSRGACLACHDATRFQPSKFDAALHADTRFPLTGGHRSVSCDKCHDPAKPVGERFAPASIDCASCHEDVHHGQFDGAGRPREIGGKTGCARCHTTDGFKAVHWSGDEHRTWTGFALEGAHAKAECAACHKPTKTYQATFGSTPQECAKCHEDAHKGKLKKEVACSECHDTTAFSGVKWTAEAHKTWTGFALSGAHGKLACEACHKASQKSGVAHRSFGFASADCASCHKDPHAGQFEQAGVTDCKKCHAGENSFRPVTFNHQTDSRFKLDEFHATLDCGVCHRPYKTEKGGTAIRYKPLGARCQDCHSFAQAPGAAGK